jgi:hypothetical protein
MPFGEVLEMPITLPSAGARISTTEPTEPLAPGRFSMTTVRPRAAENPGCTIRAVTSEAPPGAKGTIIRMAEAPCARTSCGAARQAVPRSRAERRRMGDPGKVCPEAQQTARHRSGG